MELNYCILPGNSRQLNAGLTLHNKVFDTWMTFWTEVLANLPSSCSPNPNEFSRQTFISALFTPNYEVVGFSLHSLFNLKSKADINHSYFTQNYDSQLVSRLEARNLGVVMTFEYLTIKSEFRSKNLGYPLAPVLAGLAHQLQKEINVDASIASCRSDFKVDKIAKMFGATELSEGGTIHGVKTQNMLSLTEEITLPPELKPAIDALWNKRLLWPTAITVANPHLVTAA